MQGSSHDDISLLRRPQRQIDDLGTQPALLSLEHVDDPERPEAGYFALIDPEWSGVAEFCLLDEALVGCLERLGADAVAKAPLRSAA
ncbi:MAG: hypothetical protein ACU0B9_19435 [Limimaricola soesokkakensis]|uniref:hypothetical protein n=1 Tax=Limimaricola soesokkakensis TaxID=1343159 RepID=UPI004057D095